ncbi:hypothetical protein C0992_006200 [Termitomyces sp. T32_za158]|nr:hypothetical protein C0992_006200 [Termitomyces sp. T32_za158]
MAVAGYLLYIVANFSANVNGKVCDVIQDDQAQAQCPGFLKTPLKAYCTIAAVVLLVEFYVAVAVRSYLTQLKNEKRSARGLRLDNEEAFGLVPKSKVRYSALPNEQYQAPVYSSYGPDFDPYEDIHPPIQGERPTSEHTLTQHLNEENYGGGCWTHAQISSEEKARKQELLDCETDRTRDRAAEDFEPRDIDPAAVPSLRFFFANILLLNSSSIWSHATRGAAEGRAIVLDFVGMGYVPSKIQLLSLDFLIIFLQFTLTTIAYETSLHEHGSNTPDMLLPIPIPPSPMSAPLLAQTPSTSPNTTMTQHTKSSPPPVTSPYVIDLRLAPIITRLRNPSPLSRATTSDALLPLPNTTPWPLPARMRMLLQARAQIRGAEGTTTDNTRIPGSLGSRNE